MPARNVELTERLDAFVDSAVDSGRYQDPSEVVRDALRLLETRTREDDARLSRLRGLIAEAEQELASGDAEDVAANDLGAWLAALGNDRPDRSTRS